MMRMRLPKVLFLLLALFSMQACVPQGKSTDPDETLSPQPEYGAFEDYAFVLDGQIIEQQMLVDHPGAVLTAIFPYVITWDHRDYHGAVYFNSQKEPVSSTANVDHPAYFIDGTQVSPYNIRLLAPDAYDKIEKWTGDTTIKGTRYNGSINFFTKDDFFAEHIALPELLDRYTGLSPDQVIVHWRGPHYSNASGIGTVIDSHFPIYYIDPDNLQSVEINCIQFADGDRYVVELVDRQYNRWAAGGQAKGRKGNLTDVQRVSDAPLAKDVTCPCCVADAEVTRSAVFTRPEIGPTPLEGEGVYLRKLSNIMGLPVEKPTALVSQDSITVQFMVTKTGMLAALESIGIDKPEHIDVLKAMRWHSCAWSSGIMSGIPVLTKRKMTIFYRKDESGHIQSLDRLAYRPYLH